MRAQPDFSTSPRPQRPAGWEVAAATLAALLLAIAAHGAWRARAEAGEVKARLAKVRREIDSAQSRLRGLGARTAATEEMFALAAVASEAPPGQVVADVAAALPGDVRLERLSIAYGRTVSLEVDVVARGPEAWDGFLERLEREPSLQEVTSGPETREGEVRTTVRARYVGGGR